jgi:tetratricopeptide (TPR) repeat protein
MWIVLLAFWLIATTPALAQPAEELANDAMARAVTAFQQGRREEAVKLWEQALAGYRAAGDVKRQAYALENLGTAAQLMNDPRRAVGVLQRKRRAGASRQRCGDRDPCAGQAGAERQVNG